MYNISKTSCPSKDGHTWNLHFFSSKEHQASKVWHSFLLCDLVGLIIGLKLYIQ